MVKPIPTPRRWRQEDQELKVILRYLVNSRLAWTDPVSKKTNSKNNILAGYMAQWLRVCSFYLGNTTTHDFNSKESDIPSFVHTCTHTYIYMYAYTYIYIHIHIIFLKRHSDDISLHLG